MNSVRQPGSVSVACVKTLGPISYNILYIKPDIRSNTGAGCRGVRGSAVSAGTALAFKAAAWLCPSRGGQAPRRGEPHLGVAGDGPVRPPALGTELPSLRTPQPPPVPERWGGHGPAQGALLYRLAGRGSPRPRLAPPPAASTSGADRRFRARGTMALCERAVSGGALVWPRVLLFGDSITQFSFQQGGWGALLADRLVRKCDVLNRGFSGYNTRWAKIILPRLIRKGSGVENPVAVTIFFGANDCSLRDENPKQHVPLEEYRANLRDMVQYLKSVDIPGERIILITPPPLGEAAWEKECLLKGCKLNRLNSVAGEYANACLTVARDCGTEVLDLWTLMQKDKQDFSSYLSDGLHLSPMGNEFLFLNLWPLLDKKVSSLPWLLPYWKDVEEAKPERSLLGDGDH